MTRMRLIFVISVVFVKIAVLNGLTALCIILPLAPRLPRILMPCANPLKFPNLSHPPAIPPRHHAVSANTITPRTTLTNLVVPNVVDRVAALPAVPLVNHPAVIIRTMIEQVVDPLVHVMTTTSVTMTSLMIHQPSNMTAP